MADFPADLSPFRSLVRFSGAGSHVALVSLVISGGNSLRNWIEFVDPAIGEFGLARTETLPSDEDDKTKVYGYHVFSGSTSDSPFGTLNLVNAARTLADHPDENRTHLVLDHVFEPFRSDDPGRTGHIRCDVHRGPLLTDIIDHVEEITLDHFGSTFDSIRTAFQYRRDGIVDRTGEFEQAITVDTVQRKMRISIPLAGGDPTFNLI